jgi:hypothetical protein
LVLAIAPGDRFNFHTAALTVDPTHEITEIDYYPPERNKLKITGLWLMVVHATRLMTPRTHRLTVFARFNVDDDAGLAAMLFPSFSSIHK